MFSRTLIRTTTVFALYVVNLKGYVTHKDFIKKVKSNKYNLTDKETRLLLNYIDP